MIGQNTRVVHIIHDFFSMHFTDYKVRCRHGNANLKYNKDRKNKCVTIVHGNLMAFSHI